MIIKVPHKVLLALQVFQARNDVRYYLNGICFYPDGSAAATDGHRAIKITGLDKLKENIPFIINFSQKIPTSKWNYVAIDTDKLISFFNNDSAINVAVSLFEIINGRFPDIDRAIPKGEPQPTAEISFNAKYIADVYKVAKLLSPKFEGVKFSFHGPISQAVATVTTPEGYKAKMIVMPMRL